MAKKRPSGDVVEDDALVIVDPVAVVDDAPEVAAPVLPDGHIWVDVFDTHRSQCERVAIPSGDLTFTIRVGGRTVHHVSDAPDGAWQFA